jgi:hypothetical protein
MFRCPECGEQADFLVRISSLAALVRNDGFADGLSINVSEKAPADYKWVALHCGRCGHEGPRQDFEGASATGAADPAVPATGRRPVLAELQQALEAFIHTIEATGGCVRLPTNPAIPQEDGMTRWGCCETVPNADRDWIDLADAYLLACRALGCEPTIRATEGDPDGSDPLEKECDLKRETAQEFRRLDRAAGTQPPVAAPTDPLTRPRSSHTHEQDRRLNMSAWYSLSGSIRLRECPEVRAILNQMQDHCGDDLRIDATETGSGELGITIEGCAEFPAGEAIKLDEMIQSLGLYALEAAIFSGVYDYDPCELVVAPPGDAGCTAMSRLRLDQIMPLIDDLSAEDRKRLAEGLHAMHPELDRSSPEILDQ